MKISAAIITYNEERNISLALTSLDWVDEIVVVDSESTDRTCDIARAAGAKVIVRPWAGFSDQKQFAAESCANDWVFSIDADEQVSDALRREIESRNAMGRENAADGFRIPRLTTYMGRQIRHGGWYPDLQLRLFDRRKGRWNGRLIHESVSMDKGAVVKVLKSDILHETVEGPLEHLRRIGDRYAPLGAEQMRVDGKQSGPLRTAAAGPAAFIRGYFLRLGFLDGFPGFCIAKMAAHNAFMKHLLLWQSSSIEEAPEGTD